MICNKMRKTGPIGPKNSKNCRKTENRLFHKNLFFDNFKLNMGGLGVSGGMAWTMRADFLEVWRDLVLHGMGEVDLHVFWKYWKLTSSPNTSKLVLGPPGWSPIFFRKPGHHLRKIKLINVAKNTPWKTHFPGTWTAFPKSSFFNKSGFLFLCFFAFL